MIWLKIKQFFKPKAVKPVPKMPVEELSSELKAEVAELAALLSAQHVSIRDVGAGEHIPDEPEVGESPL